MSETVAIIGAGPLGRWLALAAARAGFRVLLEDVMPANLHHAQEWLRQELGPEQLGEGGGLPGEVCEGHGAGAEEAAEKGLLLDEVPQKLASGAKARVDSIGLTRGLKPPSPSAASSSAGCLASAGMQGIGETAPQGLKPDIDFATFTARLKSCPFKTEELAAQEPLPITFVSTIEEAVREAELVIDCVPDELESKLEILWLLDRMAPPRTVLATPTTRLSIADLAGCTYRPGKCIAIAAEASALTGRSEAESPGPGAEIVLRTTSKTAPETVGLLDRFWRRLGFTPRFERDPAELAAG